MNDIKLDITTADGVADAHAFHPEGAGPWPGVIFFMDGIGVRPELCRMAERLASNGYFVLLPNLYYRSGPFAPFDAMTVFGGGPERDRLMTLIRAVDFAGAMRDTEAFLATLRARPEVAGAKVGCVGYCLGGGIALAAAGTFPDAIAAAATIHGARLATDQPDSPHLLAPEMRAKIYAGVAEIDHSFTVADRERLEKALTDAGVRHTVEVYPGASHGFAVGDVPVYDRTACERHWERILALFAEMLP